MQDMREYAEEKLYYTCPYCGYEKCERDDIRCELCDALLIDEELLNKDSEDALYADSLSTVDKSETSKRQASPVHSEWQKKGGCGGKIFVLDTCTLMQTDGMAIFGFEDNEVNITTTTLEELDNLKTAPGEKGYQARASIRVIDNLKEKGYTYMTGIPLNRGGVFRIIDNFIKDGLLPKGWSYDKADNRIIATVLANNSRSDEWGCKTYLVTQDNGMRIKALCAGCEAQVYRNEEADEDTYTGRTEIVTSSYGSNAEDEDEDVMPMIERFWHDKKLDWIDHGAFENEYFVIRDGNDKALARYNNGCLHPINQKGIAYAHPTSDGQRFALDALLSPASEIPLVLLIGAAGCGKTYLSIAAGLDGVYARRHEDAIYDTMIITRPNAIPDGEDLGFLPGTLEEKMDPLLAPFHDNLRSMLIKDKKERRSQLDMQIREIMQDYVKIVSLAYIRGRSIPNSFIIVDEAQNLTVQQAKTIVTRCGVGTKLVLCGDPAQIDQARLSKRNNGLVYIAEKMKGDPLCAQITFDTEKETTRSPLATTAAKKL